MPKQTLLDLVQDILNDLDSDPVNSISDTEESEQVAAIVKSTYYEVIDSRDWPHLNRTITLSPTGGTAITSFTLDDNFDTIDFVKYNKRKSTDTKDKYDEVDYLTPKEFIEHLNARNSSASDVSTITIDSIKYYVKNDTAPTYWTTFDDEIIVMDSYDSAVDSNLQASKTQCWGRVTPTWTVSDTFVPDLPAKAFSYLLAESKSTSFNSLRQAANAKEEQKSNRQRLHLSREKWRVNGGMQFPNYGRK
jgi:hypothetical protein